MATCSPSAEEQDVVAGFVQGFLPQLMMTVLQPRDKCVAAQVCHSWRAAANEEYQWAHLAAQLYPEQSVKGHAGYPTYKALVLDDNRINSVAALNIPCPARCPWYHNRHDLHYECHLLQCEMSWSTSDNIRVIIEARGETDLRLPCTSSLVIQHLPPSSLERRQVHIISRGAGPVFIDASGVRAPEDGQGERARELWDAEGSSGPTDDDLFAGALPEAWVSMDGMTPTRELMVHMGRGHYRGMLEWDAQDVDRLRQALTRLMRPWTGQSTSTSAETSKAPKGGFWRLAFCYACDLARTHYMDYIPITLLLGPVSPVEADSGAMSPLLDRMWRAHATYQPRGLSEQHARQSLHEDQSKAVWRAILPKPILNRFDEWWAPSMYRSDAVWRKVLKDQTAWLLGHEHLLDEMMNMLDVHEGEVNEEEMVGGEEQAYDYNVSLLVADQDDEDEDED